MSSDELTALLGVADSVRAGRRHRQSEDEDAVSLTPEEAAENLAALLDASAYKRVRIVWKVDLAKIVPTLRDIFGLNCNWVMCQSFPARVIELQLWN